MPEPSAPDVPPEGATDADGVASRSTRVERTTLLAIVVVAAVGLGAFGVTAALRSSDGDAAPASTTTGATSPATSPPASATTVGSGESADDEPAPGAEGATAPSVVEVELGVAAPIPVDAEGRPAAPESYDGPPGDVDDVVSPIVGTMTVDAVSDDDGRTGATPALFSGALGPDRVEPEAYAELPTEAADLDAVGPIEPDVVSPDVDVDQVMSQLAELADDYVATSFAEAVATDDSPAEEPGDTIEESGSSPGEAPDARSGADDEPRFVDPCADDPTPDPDRCPDPGEPGTVIQTFALTVPPPLRIDVHIPAGDRCSEPESRFDHRVAVVSTTPLTSFDFAVVSHPGAFSLATPPAQAEAWMNRFAASDADPPPPILHCATLTEQEPEAFRVYDAEATDTFDRTWTHRDNAEGAYFFGPEYAVPPTYLLRLSDNELLVSAPHRADQTVAVLAYRRTDEPLDAPVDPCVGSDRLVTGFALPQSPLEPERIDVSRSDLEANGWDPAYVHRTIGTMRLEEGSTFRVCVHTGTTRPSFSAGREQTLAYDISTPDALSIGFRVLRVDAEGPGIEASRLNAQIRPAGRGVMAPFPFCGSWRNSTAIQGDTEIDAEICTSDPRSSALFDYGARLDLSVRDVEGTRRESSVFIPTRTCRMPCVIPPPEVFRFELPSGRTQTDFFCGLFGDDCDSASDESFGTITIEVSYSNPGGSTQSGWRVSEPLEFGDQRSQVVPETPRFDTFAQPMVSGDPTSRTVTIPIASDRPVTATVDLRSSYGGPACTIDGAPTIATADVFAETHEIEFSGICPSQNIISIVQLTDETGASSTWHADAGVGGDLPRDHELWYRGVAHVPPFRVWTSAQVEVAVPSTHARFPSFDLTISGNDIGLIPYVTRSGPGCMIIRDGVLSTMSRRSRTDPGDRVVIGTGRTIEIEFVVEPVVLRAPSCTDAVSVQPPAFVASTVVDWSEVELDVPIEVFARVPVPELGPEATVDATVSVTFHLVAG